MEVHIEDFYKAAVVWLIAEGPRILLALIVFFIGLWFIKVLRTGIRNRLSQNQVHSSLQPFILSLSITALYISLILVVMMILDIKLDFFGTIIGAGTVAIGLALSGTFQNFAGGVLILLLKPFELNDNIMAQGQDGIVTSIQIFYTVILTPDNKTVIIPNGKLFNEVITNVSREGKRRLDFELKLEYAVDVDQVKEIINQAIKSIPNLLDKPAATVGVFALELDGIRFTVRVWVKPSNFLASKLALQEKVVKDLREAGVKLPGVVQPIPPQGQEADT